MNRQAKSSSRLAILVCALCAAGSAFAAEEGKSVYLLGATASMAGMTPPPGTYVSSFSYYYAGDASGSAALSRTLRQSDVTLPSTGSLSINADVSVEAVAALDVLSALWVAPEKILGGNFGFGVLLLMLPL